MNLLKNQQAAETVDSVYIDLEAQLMQNIARHLSDWGQPIDTDRWLLQKLGEIGKLNRENIKIIARMSGISQTAAERMLNEMAEEAVRNMEPGFQYLARRGLVEGAVDYEKSKNVKQTMSNLRQQAKDSLNLTNTTMLHKAQEAFLTLAQNTATEALKIMNNNTSAVITGAESRQQALRKTIRQFNDAGITGFVDKRGRNWTPEAYVNMSMRTTSGNVTNEVQTARCKDYGINLIAVDSHSGARPKCAKDQGKIFDLNNGSGYTEDLNGKKIRYYPFNSSSYGEPDGLFGINCGHHKFPFIPGVNVQRYFPTEDLDANNRLYKQTQVQRSLERDVRKQKRECVLYDEIGDTEAFEESAVKLKVKETKLKGYVDQHENLHRRKDREQVVGFDKMVSAESISANKRVLSAQKTVVKKTGSGIIKIDAKPGTSKYRKIKKQAIIEKGASLKKPIFTDDAFGKLAANIPKKEGCYDVVIHGAPKAVSFFGERTDAKTIAEILKQRKDYNGGPIRLLSCSTGKGKDCFAQRLANELGVVVEAPDDVIWARSDKTYTIGPTIYKNTGAMKTFVPEVK